MSGNGASISIERQNSGARIDAAIQSGPPKNLLLVLSDDEDYQRIYRVVKRAGWVVSRSRTVKEASAALAERPVLVVITDKLPHTNEWKHAAAQGAPKVIFAYRFREANAALQLLRNGVHQILARPFQDKEVLQVLGFAWTLCKREWRQ